MSRVEKLPRVSFTEEQVKEAKAKIARLTEAVQLDGLMPLTEEEAAVSKRLGRENLIGFGWGLKMVNGAFVDKMAICGFVVKKAPIPEIDPDYLIDSLVKKTLGSDELTDVLQVGRPRTFVKGNS